MPTDFAGLLKRKKKKNNNERILDNFFFPVVINVYGINSSHTWSMHTIHTRPQILKGKKNKTSS